jgi:putative DeoR family transcriptional regulator (stage III sporulation protein D)
MNSLIIRRVLDEATYMLNTKQTIREIATVFNVSKSTVHNDIQKKLLNLNYKNYVQVSEIMKKHIETRHLKGGEATKLKYQSR